MAPRHLDHSSRKPRLGVGAGVRHRFGHRVRHRLRHLAAGGAAAVLLAGCASASASHNVDPGGTRGTTTGAPTTRGGSSSSTSPNGGTTGTNTGTNDGTSSTTTLPGGPPPMPQPTASKPLVMLDVGDSLGIDLSWGLDDIFANDPLVHVIDDAVGDTGLARPDYYDWPEHLEQELQEYHPGAVVVMIGGNDGQSFVNDGEYLGFGTALWHQVYSQRVATFMQEATSAGAHVFWVGMPIMQAQYLANEMNLEDQIYAAEAATHPGVTYFSSWQLFEDSAGQYSQYLPDSQGQSEMMRDDDGVHLTGVGAEYLGDAILQPMEKAFGVRLTS